MSYESCFESEDSYFNKRYMGLNQKIFEVIENFNLLQFLTVNIMDEESVGDIILQIDSLIQFDEYRIPKDHFDLGP